MKTKHISTLILCLVCTLPAQAVDWTSVYIQKYITWVGQDAGRDLEVNLPNAEEGEHLKKNKNEKLISITQNGKIVMDSKTYTLEGLQKELTKLAKLNKNQAIRVRGDAKTDYKHIVQVIDHCRKAGIWNMSFATGKETAQPNSK